MVDEVLLERVPADVRVAVVEVAVPLAAVLAAELLGLPDGDGVERVSLPHGDGGPGVLAVGGGRGIVLRGTGG